jgi:predicted O-methyltransferase YrrM
MKIEAGKNIMRNDYSKQGLLDLIAYIGDTKQLSMIEIGTFIGESTIIFAEHFKSVIGIDPFLAGYDPEDPTSRFDFNEVYQEYLSRTKPFPNIKTITLTSDDAISQLEGQIFDFIYIDGLHQYEQVKTDITNYMRFIKPNGIIAGHDYGPTWPGVAVAVNEIFGEPDNIFQDTSWIKRL